MTINIYHKSGPESGREVVVDVNERLYQVASLSSYGGMEGVDTTFGRLVVQAPRDWGQDELPIQIHYPDQQIKSVGVKPGVYVQVDFGLTEKTPFGLTYADKDTIVLERLT